MYEISPPTTTMNSWMNLIKKTFINHKGRPPYASVIQYALHLRDKDVSPNVQVIFWKISDAILSLLNKIQQGGVDI